MEGVNGPGRAPLAVVRGQKQGHVARGQVRKRTVGLHQRGRSGALGREGSPESMGGPSRDTASGQEVGACSPDSVPNMGDAVPACM